jgi:hypothetical protein
MHVERIEAAVLLDEENRKKEMNGEARLIPPQK